MISGNNAAAAEVFVVESKLLFRSPPELTSDMDSASSAPTTIQACEFCHFDFPLDRTHCPHCSRPMLFPNVGTARRSDEKEKLAQRLNEALADADQRACRPTVDRFTENCRSTSAVIRCNLARLHRQVASGSEIFAPYYDIERLKLRTTAPGDFNYEKLRPQAEIELLGNAKHIEKLHYACLSLDGQGLSSFGDCILRLDERMIAHRASCFEGNTAVIYAVDHGFSEYVRSDWETRHMICTAVMAHRVNCSVSEADFPGILVAPDPNNEAENDVFIEVHIFGDMTARTFESVEIDTTNHRRSDRVYVSAVEEKLKAADVAVTVG